MNIDSVDCNEDGQELYPETRILSIPDETTMKGRNVLTTVCQTTTFRSDPLFLTSTYSVRRKTVIAELRNCGVGGVTETRETVDVFHDRPFTLSIEEREVNLKNRHVEL